MALAWKKVKMYAFLSHFHDHLDCGLVVARCT